MTGRRARGAALAAIALLAATSASVRAQQSIPIAPELRLDVLGATPSSVQGGIGMEIPMGYYVRLGLLAGAGATIDGDDAPRAAGRVDLLARFLLDPFRQARWGFSAGGGVSLRADPGDRVRPRLLVALDLEGRRSRGGVSPSLQVGLGGGVRGGVGLRWSGRNTR
ncbi:MAG: hypothetical protein DMD35_20420 [Gemmatimonadetes bacterium]|nr:MAG: hypothetical protein DMD35_20420 [Gemmatimonadota bacterium]